MADMTVHDFDVRFAPRASDPSSPVLPDEPAAFMQSAER